MISGMRDNRSREQVLEALEQVAGLKEAEVNLFRARAIVLHAPPCTVAQLVQAVVQAGYGATLAAD